jgi:hypothetical protein
MSQTPELRGTLVAAVLAWYRGAYDEALSERAIASLPGEDRQHLTRRMMSLGWIPLLAMERFTEAMFSEVQRATGEERASFDRRVVEGAGGQFMKLFFQMVLAWVKPQHSLQHMPALYARAYRPGTLVVLENLPGAAVLQLRAPLAMRDYLLRYIPLAQQHLLYLSKASDVSLEALSLATEGDDFIWQARIQYR